ncbi:MAG: hypothetical protein KGM99_09020 [Burkholderiales bacterium]|nr:hypothetical protein [Burkholderiales bacterium]
MITKKTNLILCELALLLFAIGNAAAQTKANSENLATSATHAFRGTGVFQGQGRACFGKLYIRQKSIEWHTSFSACERSAYSVIDKDLTGTKPHMAFLLHKTNPKCHFRVIGISFDPAYPDYWNAVGYVTRADFEQHQPDALDEQGKILSCSVQPD